ncbi:hypothetical protein CDAR_180101 [Caerostris darwini]|uniref:Ycf15 n=1 Tax=Caerostris darwini TaxID=1538125 RepID=A0AAV4TYK7_9ARAC|nr:hypothetical protein CDAR_180101 [Caerostris darwini]
MYSWVQTIVANSFLNDRTGTNTNSFPALSSSCFRTSPPEHSISGLVIQLFGFRLIIGTSTVLFPTEIIGEEEPPCHVMRRGELLKYRPQLPLIGLGSLSKKKKHGPQ